MKFNVSRSALKLGKKTSIKVVFKFFIIVILPLVLFIKLSMSMLHHNNYLVDAKLFASSYAKWNMDDNDLRVLSDSTGKYSAIAVNAKLTKGKFNKARYLNGKDSYIATPINFKGWDVVTISLLVKPYRKNKEELSAVLDNGHDANSNFVIQSADNENPNSDRWVWHCNGVDVFLRIPFNEWTHIIVVADGKNGIVKAYINGINVGNVTTKSFGFNDTNLTIGKLSKSDSRYFKGCIDEVIILNYAFTKE